MNYLLIATLGLKKKAHPCYHRNKMHIYTFMHTVAFAVRLTPVSLHVHVYVCSHVNTSLFEERCGTAPRLNISQTVCIQMISPDWWLR